MHRRQQLTVHGYVNQNYETNKNMIDIIEIIYAYYLIIMDTFILSSDEQMKFIQMLHDKLKQIQSNNKLSFNTNLLFRGSEWEFDSYKFHDLCDNKGPTITIIQNEYNHVFGGYSTKSWNLNCQIITDPTAFLFVIRPQIKIYPLKESENEGYQAMWNRRGYGPIYGKPQDIFIGDSEAAKYNRISWSLSKLYQFDPVEMCGGTKNKRGCVKFKLIDYEVFSIDIKSSSR